MIIGFFHWYCLNILLLFRILTIWESLDYFIGIGHTSCFSCWALTIWEWLDNSNRMGKYLDVFGRKKRERREEKGSRQYRGENTFRGMVAKGGRKQTPRERSTPGNEDIASTHFILLFLAAYPTGVYSSHIHHSISPSFHFILEYLQTRNDWIIPLVLLKYSPSLLEYLLPGNDWIIPLVLAKCPSWLLTAWKWLDYSISIQIFSFSSSILTIWESLDYFIGMAKYSPSLPDYLHSGNDWIITLVLAKYSPSLLEYLLSGDDWIIPLVLAKYSHIFSFSSWILTPWEWLDYYLVLAKYSPSLPEYLLSGNDWNILLVLLLCIPVKYIPAGNFCEADRKHCIIG